MQEQFQFITVWYAEIESRILYYEILLTLLFSSRSFSQTVLTLNACAPLRRLDTFTAEFLMYVNNNGTILKKFKSRLLTITSPQLQCSRSELLR